HHGARSKHSHETMWRRGSHEPLVSEEAFRAVQETYERREGMAPRHATGQYPLTGVAFCGVCGGKIHVLPRTRQNGYSYRCSNYMNGVGCGGGQERSLASASGPAVEDNLLLTMNALSQPEGLDRYFAQLNRDQSEEDKTEAEIRRLEDQIARAQRAIKAWDLTLEESKSSAEPLSYDAYLEKVAPHRQAIGQAKAALAEARKKPAPPVQEVLAAAAMDLRRAWQHLAPPERKALLQQFCEAYRLRILVYPDRRVALVPA
ncbi:MAG TPA: zinc ribbon domain-containing protein, partial [Symbiobacteriaceae bacterium]|nr:zinc ribbon domain-containing protein [Symbiobacteriaceae bacterium]